MGIDDRTCERIARRVVELLREESVPKEDELVTTAEAARLLKISPDRMRHLKDLFPHVQNGDRGKLLFVRKGLIEKYINK